MAKPVTTAEMVIVPSSLLQAARDALECGDTYCLAREIEKYEAQQAESSKPEPELEERMKNGECPTWFVVKWLTEHHTHAANSPKTEGSLSSEFAFVSHDRNGTPVIVGATLVRSNWTIYDEHGSKVDFKRKRESLAVGELIK